jgi:hypothetical protein
MNRIIKVDIECSLIESIGIIRVIGGRINQKTALHWAARILNSKRAAQ